MHLFTLLALFLLLLSGFYYFRLGILLSDSGFYFSFWIFFSIYISSGDFFVFLGRFFVFRDIFWCFGDFLCLGGFFSF